MAAPTTAVPEAVQRASIPLSVEQEAELPQRRHEALAESGHLSARQRDPQLGVERRARVLLADQLDHLPGLGRRHHGPGAGLARPDPHQRVGVGAAAPELDVPEPQVALLARPGADQQVEPDEQPQHAPRVPEVPRRGGADPGLQVRQQPRLLLGRERAAPMPLRPGGRQRRALGGGDAAAARREIEHAPQDLLEGAPGVHPRPPHEAEGHRHGQGRRVRAAQPVAPAQNQASAGAPLLPIPQVPVVEAGDVLGGDPAERPAFEVGDEVALDQAGLALRQLDPGQPLRPGLETQVLGVFARRDLERHLPLAEPAGAPPLHLLPSLLGHAPGRLEIGLVRAVALVAARG
jgi:hypothetical protein